MGSFLIVVFIVVICIASSVAHEADMRRAIKKYGHTGYSGWLGRIKGSIYE